ncbi:MAG: glycosyltransferase [Gemmatimonadaceae bacterium]
MLSRQVLRILQVSITDRGGGAEQIAWRLFESFRARGHRSWLAVGQKRSADPDVFVIPNHVGRGPWYDFWQGVAARAEGVRGAWRVGEPARALAEPTRTIDRYRGFEDFHFPGTGRLLDLTPELPDVIHCHNLHGRYFDLRALQWLSHRRPVVLTLHDPWLLSGHCSHSLECDRWETGCGQCPDLTLHQRVERDATAHNWRRKQAIYVASRLHVATPSRWLMDRVQRSMLAPAAAETRVIPHGVDLTVFRPLDRRAARETLGIPADARVLLFTANGIRRHRIKDYETLRSAVALVAAHLRAQRVLFVALGDGSPSERIGEAEIRFVPFQDDPQVVARYYQAADIYIHAARADTFPNVVLEALACGKPVVATAVGGIPEQVRSLAGGVDTGAWQSYTRDQATGALVPLGDAAGLAAAVERLLGDDALLEQVGANAVADARARFDLQRHADDYLRWYDELRRRYPSTAGEPRSTVGS